MLNFQFLNNWIFNFWFSRSREEGVKSFFQAALLDDNWLVGSGRQNFDVDILLHVIFFGYISFLAIIRAKLISFLFT
jgi:hypothetical protein